MSNLVQLDPKLQGETKSYSFDFTSKLAIGETISTQSVAATVYSGVDGSPGAIVSGAATASGNVVKQTITAGVTGVIYKLVCKITTSTSQTLQLTGFLVVIPDLT